MLRILSAYIYMTLKIALLLRDKMLSPLTENIFSKKLDVKDFY